MNYQINYSSVRGSKHETQNKSNQDAVAYQKRENVAVIALADGAGSRKWAEVGAKTVVHTIAEYVCDHFEHLLTLSNDEIQQELFEVLRQALHSVATQYDEESIHEFGSTLLFVGSDTQNHLLGHLGDGCIIGYTDDTFILLSYPENGADENTTYFTTSFCAKEHLKIRKENTNEMNGVLLLSDGLMPLLFDSGYLTKKNDKIQSIVLNDLEAKPTDDASYIMMNWRN